MNKVYVLSGLGVDFRVFDTFEFQGMDVEFMPWIRPLQNDTLPSYAKRMAEVIQEKNSVILGLSFGGMVAVEIAKIHPVKKVILLASAKGRIELPKLFSLMGHWGINKIIPPSVLKHSNFITYWLFGIHIEAEKRLLKQILKDTDELFLVWAIGAILNWQNIDIPSNVIHIHGNKDRILPIRNIKYDYMIVNGGHFMTVNHASEIEKILMEVL